MFTSSHPTASKYIGKLSCAAGVFFTLLSLSAAPALAKEPPAPKAPDVPKPADVANAPATAAAGIGSAVCEGQKFAQPFAAFNDFNYYTNVPGGEFSGSTEGWELSGGAHIVQTTGPEGNPAGALDLPSGAQAVSPPMCVTLEYPVARVWVLNGSAGKDGVVTASMLYANKHDPTHGQTLTSVGPVSTQQNAWSVSPPFNVEPQVAGREEGAREVRFVLSAGGHESDFKLYGLYVDPRMK